MNIYYEIMYCYKYVLNSVVYFFYLLFCFFNFSGLHGLFSFFDGVCWIDDDIDGPGRASSDVVGKDGGVVVVLVILARLAMEDLPFDVLLQRVVDSNDDSQKSPTCQTVFFKEDPQNTHGDPSYCVFV